jgi:threonine dehydrogenase-like Zn-dependent dehydrogenase
VRQLTFISPGKVEWWDAPAPKPQGAGEAIVHPLAVARCDLDLLIANGSVGWPGPFALGHEIAGEVVEVGDAVKAFRPGDKVIVPFQISCGACAPCRRGRTGECVSVPFRASYGMAPLSGVDWGGALSDLVRVPFADHMLVAQPQEMDAATAAGLADNVLVGYENVVPHLQQNPGARVLVVGGMGQGVGLYTVEAARAFGAAEVVYADCDEKRIALAAGFGATIVRRVEPDEDGLSPRFPITVDASGTAAGLAYAIRSTDHGGVCHRSYGDMKAKTEVPLRDMYGIGLQLVLGRTHARPLMPMMAEHVRCGALNPSAIVTRRALFSEAAEAILDPTIKVVFVQDA